jgi:hypothetical protein
MSKLAYISRCAICGAKVERTVDEKGNLVEQRTPSGKKSHICENEAPARFTGEDAERVLPRIP